MQGTEIAKSLLEENMSTKKVLLIVDPDVDGLFSAYLCAEYLEKRNIEYQYYVNRKRRHGFFIDLDKLDNYIVIATDFAIKREILEEIKARNIVLINIDHHKITEEELIVWDKGIIINNQYKFEPEEDRFLSGAGVVYEVLKTWDSTFETITNTAIVGITLLSDARPIENEKAKKILTCTFNRDNSEGYFKYLIDNTLKTDFGFGIPKMDRNFIDYTFSPRINSMLRFDEGTQAFEFLLGYGLNTEDKRQLQRDYSEFLLNCSKIYEYENVFIIELHEEILNDYLPLEYAGIEATCFIGMACSRKMQEGKNALILYYKEGVLIRGSFRGKMDGIDYLRICRECGMEADGHEPAFGILSVKEDFNWNYLDMQIGLAERNKEPTNKIIEVNNLNMFCNQVGLKYAIRNNFVRDSYRTLIRYTGTDIKLTANGEKYQEYYVDGIRVKSFDKQITPENAVIVPVLEKGYINWYCRVYSD